MKRDLMGEETGNSGLATRERAFGNRKPKRPLHDSSRPDASGADPAQP